MRSTTDSPLDVVLRLAGDLTTSLTAQDRYRRLVETVRSVLPCDSVALLRVDGDVLVPVATHGLAPEVMGERFPRRDHPRLDILCRAQEPTRFPSDTDLPDPFDGRMLSDPHGARAVHACLGCPLRVEGTLVGVLAADSLDPHGFDDVDTSLLAALGALAGAAMRTSELIAALEQDAARQRRVVRDLVQGAEGPGGRELLGTSPPMERLRQEIALVARTDLAVLVTGETGTGKELVARAIHAQSSRSDRPFLHVNCAALPESVAESELFGHVRGAFTGADRDRAGKFEVADGGTILLDEVGELPLSLQPKLLRVLQNGEVQRVGSDAPLRVDVRVIAATNRDLAAEVAAGLYRRDLYHRLHVYRIHVPALRERAEDVPILAGRFCEEMAARLGLGTVRLSRDARAALQGDAWLGNVRELEHVVSRAVLRASAGVARGAPVIVESRHLGGDVGPSPAAAARAAPAVAPPPPTRTLREATDAFVRERVAAAVDAAGGNWAAAARALGMHRSNLHHLARRLGLLGPVRRAPQDRA